MNDSRLIENQLRSWKLRRPSERLREGIFGERHPNAEAVSAFRCGEVFRWLVPVMGCFLLVIGSLSPRPTPGLHNAHASLQFQDSIRTPASLNDSNTEQNSVPHTTLEWTFGARSPSSMASFINFKTNTLRH